jgi:putative membrane protein insertion efficiency factor
MKKVIRTCIITIHPWVVNVFAQADLKNDIQFLRNIQPKEHPHPSYHFIFDDDQGSFKRLFSNMFIGYKKFVSSQDAQHCGFEPSCSVYGLMALKNHGFVGGMLRTFDRISRCNGVNQKDYPVHWPSGLKYDPPLL